MKRFLSIAAMGLALSANATTYYFDFASGNDANNGTSTSTPKKRHFYMNGYSGPAYVHAAGDRFIFKGGVTWPRSAFQLTIGSGGTLGARDYYGIDTNWFTPSLYSIPVATNGVLNGAYVTIDSGNYYLDYVSGTTKQLISTDMRSVQSASYTLPSLYNSLFTSVQSNVFSTLAFRSGVGLSVRRYSMDNALASTLSMIDAHAFGDSDSRGDALLYLRSGGLILAWHQQTPVLTNGTQNVFCGVSYLAPGSTNWIDHFPIAIPGTSGVLTSFSEMGAAQHPSDGSVWFFFKRDSYAWIDSFSALESAGDVSITTHPAIISQSLNGVFGPDGETPWVIATPDLASSSLKLAYQSNTNRFFTGSKGAYIAIANISTAGVASSFVALPQWQERALPFSIMADASKYQVLFRTTSDAGTAAYVGLASYSGSWSTTTNYSSSADFRMKTGQNGQAMAWQGPLGVWMMTAPSAWTRPVFDFENSQIGGGGSSSAGVLVQNAPFITFEGIDIKRHRSPVSFGASSVSLFGTTSSVTFTNCIVRDWSVAGTGSGSDAGGGIQNYSSGSSFFIVSCLLHQDNESNKCGYATKGINEVAYSEIRNTPNAVFAYTTGHHNHVHHIPNCTDPSSHANAMATTGPATTYANLIHDLGTGASAIYVTPNWSGGSNIDLVYNNVVYNVGLQAPIQLDTGGANTPSIGLRAYNNVLVANGGGYCIRVVERGTSPYGVLDVRNCQFIATGTPLGYNNPGAGNGNVTTVTLANNLTQTPAAATSAGYVSGNDFAPTALTSPTVRAGTDLSTVFNVDRLGTIRPSGLWDIAAYQFAAGGITNPPPPIPRSPDTPIAVSPPNGAVDVSLRPVLTASAFSDPQGSAQIASQFIILQSGSIVRDSGIYVAGTTYPVPDPLTNFTAYAWQARYQNAFGLWSDYSGMSGFTTTNIVITNVPPPSTNPPPIPPPPSGVRLRVVRVNAGMIRAK